MTQTENEKLADRIEHHMKDAALHDEGHVFDLMPDEQQAVISALRQPAGVSEEEIAKAICEAAGWPWLNNPDMYGGFRKCARAVLALINRPQTGEADTPHIGDPPR